MLIPDGNIGNKAMCLLYISVDAYFIKPVFGQSSHIIRDLGRRSNLCTVTVMTLFSVLP